MNIEQILFKLLQLTVNKDYLNNVKENDWTDTQLTAVFVLSQKHDLAHLVTSALERICFPETAVFSKFAAAKQQAVYRYLRTDHAYKQLCMTLETAGISFIPLKGAVLCEYYPESWMRTSCDIDILVHENDLDCAVEALTKQGWCVEGKKNYHDISLYSQSGVHLELHFNIKENISCIDEVLEKVWKYSSLVEGKQYEYRQTNEFLLFHLLAHMSYHFLRGGCGIRSVLDIWTLRNNIAYDQDILRELCREGQLEKFHDNVVLLSKVWFEDYEHTPTTQYMEKLILDGGVYGSLPGRVILGQAQSGSKEKHIMHRIIMPYYKLKAKYPILEKHKFLIPIYQVVRWVQMFTKGRLRRSLSELKENQRRERAELKQAGMFLVEIGLDKFE